MSVRVFQAWVAPSHTPFVCVRSAHLRSKPFCLQMWKKAPRRASTMAVSGAEVVGHGKAVMGLMLQIVDPWAPTTGSGININSQSLASQLFAASLFPYLGFLYHITRSKSSPKLTLFGFYFLLVFVAATIVAGIYAKLNYGTSLANVDWLHGSAETFLTLTNLFIVLGMRKAVRESEDKSSISEKDDDTS